jgi:hypothetical protein
MGALVEAISKMQNVRCIQTQDHGRQEHALPSVLPAKSEMHVDASVERVFYRARLHPVLAKDMSVASMSKASISWRVDMEKCIDASPVIVERKSDKK